MDTLTKSRKSKNVIAAKTISGSEAVILSLLSEQVDTVFGYPGGAIMPIYDALYHYEDRLKHLLVRHEQGATHAAQGYARVTGKVGVCFATSGPGATNLITGIADAQIDSTPIVCITGQVPSHLLGTDAFQETDVIGISMPVTKWNYQITESKEIPEILAKAFYIAKSGRPGPVVIDITKDAQIGQLDFAYQKCESIRSYQPSLPVEKESIQAAVDLINQAKRPFLLIGQGILLSNAQEVLKTFIEKTGIPTAWTILGLSALDTDHPMNVGMLGMHGNYGPNVLTNECDVLIAIGMRFDDRVTGDLKRYAKQAKVIHVEIDPSEIDKNVKTHVAVNADAKESIEAMLPLIEKRTHTEWLQRFRELNRIEYDKIIKEELNPSKGGLRMGEVVQIISEQTKGEAIIVTDVGQHQMITSRYYRFKKPHSNVTSGGLGTMGFALPAAMGAQVGQPRRPVVAVIGDGGFQMTLQELATISQYQIPVKIVILNNSFLGMVRQWQQLFFDKRYSSTEMVNPEFTIIAQGFGLNNQKVKHRKDLSSAITKMLADPKAHLVEVVVEKEENVFPMVPAGDSVANIRLE